MGRATRWLKGLFGMKKDNRDLKQNSNSGDRRDRNRPGTGLCHNPATIPPNITPAEASWLKSVCKETEKEQSKHAIAVAAASAAAADAAVAAAHAAVAVVKLTSHGRGTVVAGDRGIWAALKIQCFFRGYLARRALKALKGLVKLQAVVRGYLVRKQANATLHSMEALIRAQSIIRAQRIRAIISNDHRSRSQHHHRRPKSIERFDDTRSEQAISGHSRRLSATLEMALSRMEGIIPNTVGVDDTFRPKSRSMRTSTTTPVEDPIGKKLSSIPNFRNFCDWGPIGDECRFSSTAHNTPRFVCADGGWFVDYCPNYMASTESFKAKLRSHSAPKQRPEPGHKKRLSLNEAMMMESRSSVSSGGGVRMQRSCSQAQQGISFRNAVMGRLIEEDDRSSGYLI